jgi:uncharacterized membrane protein (TIGR02234 family)
MADTAGNGAADATGTAEAAIAPDTVAAAPARPDRRMLSLVALVAIVGGLVAWLAAGREWSHGVAGHAPNVLAVTAKGSDLSGAVTTLGPASAAAALVLFATRGAARQVLGLLLAAGGVGIGVASVLARGHAARTLADKATAKGIGGAVGGVATNSWWILAVAGGVVVAAAGVVTLLKGRDWPGMSSRYEKAERAKAVAASAAASPKGLWDALDRGEDPTGDDSED